jgi:hypothetical protein
MEHPMSTRRSRRPKAKVVAAGATGTVATALIAIANQFGVDLTAEAAGALVTLATFVAGYLKTETRP